MADRTPHGTPRRSRITRDAALRLTRRLTGVVAAGAAALTGGLALASANAFNGHGSGTTSAKRTARVAPTVPGPQAVPSVSGGDGVQPPATAPSPAPATPAPAPAAPAPAPAPTPAPAPPVSSGGS